MTAGWRILGASVQGTSHSKAGQPCQDAHAYRCLPGPVAVLAVADGAGSAERSGEGAQCAVTAAVEVLAGHLTGGWPATEAEWQAALGQAFDAARLAVAELAEAQALPPRSFATTLLCAAASEHGLAVGQVGDGVAVGCTREAAWFLAARPQRGEYANETIFVTQAEPPVVDIWLYAEPVQAVAVMTDGLLRLVLDLTRNEPHRPFFDPLLAFAHCTGDEAAGCEQLAAFLASGKVSARTDDDKTLVIAVRPPAAGAEPPEPPSAEPAP